MRWGTRVWGTRVTLSLFVGLLVALPAAPAALAVDGDVLPSEPALLGLEPAVQQLGAVLPGQYVESAALNPVNGVGTPEFTIAPELPSGLVLDVATGVVSGRPATVLPETTFTVTARIGDAAAEATLILAVTTVIPDGVVALTGAVETVLELPAADSSAFTEAPVYTVEPALPDGLLLDSATGAIRGLVHTATWVWVDRIATADGGAEREPVLIAIHPDFRVDDPNILTTVDEPVDRQVGMPVGFPEPVTYSVTPDLPLGLILESDGHIRGVPMSASDPQQFVVTASAGLWSEHVDVTLLVQSGDSTTDNGVSPPAPDPPPLVPAPSVNLVFAPPAGSTSNERRELSNTATPDPSPAVTTEPSSSGTTSTTSGGPNEAANAASSGESSTNGALMSALIAIGIAVLATIAATSSSSVRIPRRR